HEGILANLRDALQVDATGYFIQIGPVRVPVEVEDAPYSIVRLEPASDGFAVTLNDLSREPLDPSTLRLGAGEVPYCRVKGGRSGARCRRAGGWQLLEHREPGDAGARASVRVGGRGYPLEA